MGKSSLFRKGGTIYLIRKIWKSHKAVWNQYTLTSSGGFLQTVGLEDIKNHPEHKLVKCPSNSDTSFPVSTLDPCNRDDISPVVIFELPKGDIITKP